MKSGASRLASASLWMILSYAVLNLCMVLYHRQASSSLGGSYAQLKALILLANVLGILTTGPSTYLAKVFSRDSALGGPAAVQARLKALLPRLAIPVSLVGLALAAASPWVSTFLKLPSAWMFVLVVAGTRLAAVLAVLRSAVQGLHRFGLLGATLAAQGVGQYGLMACLGGRGGTFGALWAILAGGACALAAAAWAVRNTGPMAAPAGSVAPPEASRGRLGELARDTAALGLFSLLCSLDELLFKHYHEDLAASAYSRAALVAKSFLYLAAAFNLVLLPVAAAARARGEDPRPVLLKFLGAMALCLLAGLAVLWWQTGLAIRLLCGPDPAFQEAIPLVRWFSAGVIPLACYQLVLLYQLSMDLSWTLQLEGLLVAAYALGLVLFHDRAGQVVACLSAVAVCALTGGIAAAWNNRQVQREN